MKKRVLTAMSATRSGYTLVELMVVVAIVGILATLSTPTVLQARRRATARQSASELASVLRNARTQAMTRGEIVLVELSSSTSAHKVVMHAAPWSQVGDSTSPVVRSCRSGRLLGGLAGALGEDRVPDLEYGTGAMATPLLHPSMNVSSHTAGIDSQPNVLCFSPDGRVFNALTGFPVSVDLGDCERGFVMAIGTMNATTDLTAYSTDGLLGSANVLCEGKTGGFSHTIWRDSDYIYVIEVTHNGSVIIED